MFVVVVVIVGFMYSRNKGAPTPTLGPGSEPPREIAPGRQDVPGPPRPGSGGGGPSMIPAEGGKR